MAQELMGLEYLKKKEIKNMKCDMGKPFAFISYSHDDYDSQIVMNVFKQLMARGHNLWLDTANMPTDEHTWKKSAREAMRNKNCKLAIFFRSESSMVKETIAKELKTITKLKHIKAIVTVDIWHEEGIDADTYYEEVLNDESKDIDSCDSICECVSTECKAIRLAGDAGNDILILVEELEEELKAIEGITTELSDGDAEKDDIDENEGEEPIVDEIEDETENDNEDEEKNEEEETETGGEIGSDKKKSEFSDGYHYYIFGVEYHAGRRKQANLMYNTFRALINKHPEKVTDIAKVCTSVSRKDDVLNSGTRNAKPPYFRMCKEFTVSGVEYVVGSSYGFEAKIAEIYRMIGACGEDKSIFELEGFEQKKKKDKTDRTRAWNKEEAQKAGFEYTLWSIVYTANKMVDMLNDVFDLIAEKHPERIQSIAESNNITAVARKADLDRGTADISKIKQFSNYKGKEHSVNGDIYCVNAGYGREGCIKQIERMLILCDENPNVFKITKAPEKSTRSTSKSGKKGLGELLNQ